MASVGPVYEFLHEHGFLTTKTVWPLAPTQQPVIGGSSLQDPAYRERYFGHDTSTEYFWGDLCLARITYVRNFSFPGINTTMHDPMMPYHDPDRPYARYWFSSSEGGTAPAFCRTLAERNQDRLMEEGGARIMYTHLAYGFTQGSRIQPDFARLMKRLAGCRGGSCRLRCCSITSGLGPHGEPTGIRRACAACNGAGSSGD